MTLPHRKAKQPKKSEVRVLSMERHRDEEL
jgi:hypothetical protein